MAVFLARMVMPRSRSSSLESITRSTWASLARKVPLWFSMASTSVVFPWSTCAMMAMLRRLVLKTAFLFWFAEDAGKTAFDRRNGGNNRADTSLQYPQGLGAVRSAFAQAPREKGEPEMNRYRIAIGLSSVLLLVVSAAWQSSATARPPGADQSPSPDTRNATCQSQAARLKLPFDPCRYAPHENRTWHLRPLYTP